MLANVSLGLLLFFRNFYKFQLSDIAAKYIFLIKISDYLS